MVSRGSNRSDPHAPDASSAFTQTEADISKCAQYAVQSAEQRLQLLTQNIGGGATAYLAQWRERMQFLDMQIQQGAKQVLRSSEQHIDALEKVVQMADPQRILELGFSLTLKDGKPVTDAQQLTEGDRVVTLLKNGKVESEIKEIHHTK